MPFASRIHRLRRERLLSLEELAARAGLSPSLLASFENGQEVPALEMFDRLADAMDVPVERFFYDNTDSNLTPWLTPRVTWQELVGAREP
ncbi:MAG TPA: helix-turn-helix transcriptional regulator [Terriglobia bacterium]|nr:helix-turn-helix transcriptional regulator [Terriglobia bacterium]